MFQGKKYSNEDEENLRKNIFSERLEEFNAHNRRYKDGHTTYTMGINQFTDIVRLRHHATFKGVYYVVPSLSVSHGTTIIISCLHNTFLTNNSYIAYVDNEL